MTDDAKKLPAGLLAEVALQQEPELTEGAEEAQALRDAAATANPATRRADPNYQEPTTVEQYEEMHAALCRSANGIEDSVSRQRKLLITFLIGRVKVLESALLPFCVNGQMFSNSKMSLVALGRVDEPEGGTWISNPPQGISLQPNFSYFYNAIDAVGRARTEAHLTAIFKRVQQANELEAQKVRHIEEGGSVH